MQRATKWVLGPEASSLVFSGGAGPQYYEALRSTEARTRILTAAFMAGSELSRRELSLLARALYDNSGVAGMAVDMMGHYGAPVLTQAASPDAKWNDEADLTFEEFAARADFYGRPGANLEWLQYNASCSMDLDGDTLPVLTREAGFPQLQFVEAHRITTPGDTGPKVPIDQGVELDRYGRTIAYHVEIDDGKWERVPSGQAYLLYEQTPTTQRRGMTPLRRGLNDLRDVRDIIGFAKRNVKIDAALNGFIESPGGEDAGDDFDDGADGTDAEKPKAENLPPKVKRWDLEGGDIQELTNGRKFVQLDKKNPGPQFGEFTEFLTGLFVSSLGIPPAFFLGAKMTGPGWRAVIGMAQRRFNKRQEVLTSFMRWLRVRVTADAIESGRLKEVPGWDRVTFQRPPRLTIDLGDQERADMEAVQAGLMTRAEYFSRRQQSWGDQLTSTFAEDKALIEGAKQLAKETGVDEKIILAKYGFEQPKAEKSEDKDKK
ncbi:MAG: phage portal protein [Verrucomicrobia bacterium]|nr:phage portal protein [Verrucomicrobiota bacterium]